MPVANQKFALSFAVTVRRLLVVLPLLLMPALSVAEGLYSAQVPVASQSAKDRSDALKNALAQVVINLTGGDKRVLAQAAVAGAIDNAERYVQQYEYNQNVAEVNGQPVVNLQLVAQFDRNAVDQLLADLGLAHGQSSNQNEQAAVDVEPQSYHVWVSGIGSAQDFADVVGELNQNELVRNVQAQQARADGVELSLSVTGPLSRLLDSLAGSNLHVLNAKPPLQGIDALLGVQH